MYSEFERMLKRKCDKQGDVKQAIDILFASSGIEIADKLSIRHIEESIIQLESVRGGSENRRAINFDDKYAQALMAVSLKVKTRKH